MTSLSRPALRGLLAATLLLPALALAQTNDPYLWLEDIHGAKPMATVKAWNAETLAALESSPGFEADRKAAQAILDDERQISVPESAFGNTVRDFRRDVAHPHGLWREASLSGFLAGKPQWQVLIDVDALGKAEGKSWNWHGADCLPPAMTRCLVSLSPGGGDADVVREWDRTTKAFVPGGFTVPLAKSNVAWENADTLLVASDFGPGTLTESGYPREVRRWKRGSELGRAPVVAEATTSDISIGPRSIDAGAERYHLITRGKTFYTADVSIARPDGTYLRTPLPETADLRGIVAGRLVAFLNKPLGAIPAGSLVSWRIADIYAGRNEAPELVFMPSRTQAIEDVTTTDHALWIKLLDNVSGKVLQLTPHDRLGWTNRVIPLPGNATISLDGSVDSRDTVFATVQSFLQPPTLYAVGTTGAPRAIESLPAKFDARRFSVVQRFATSKDGTKVPYFLATPKGLGHPVPTLIHAYGGFRVPQTPTYLTTEPYRSGPLALDWVSDGNAYVLAQIRGGGEYGPRWHEAALREKRQNAFDDLAAVAEDLIRTGVTRKKRIAISGRSNGGVLVGAAMTQRPDLYGAVIAGSPLEDMQRYSHLSAGASWVAEYGDPDKPADWAFLSKYSPYQNVREGVSYPPVFFYLSTEDDRVHPGHARKMAAKLKAYGNRVYYREATEGGHSVGGNHAEDALRAAMLHAFLKKELGGH